MKNPFIGPHPLQKNSPIFGRDREITELRHLLIAERIVLLYSPSGAGKSSLVNAGLIEELKTIFDIWEPTRVNTQPPPEVTTNRYVWSAISGWKKPGPETNLRDFVAANTTTQNPLLVFDQFEEILRTNPTDTEGQKEFFRQLSDLLANPTIWALVVIREDFLAPLLPHFATLPTRLRARYRLDLLTTTQAETAMRSLAAQGEPSRTFQPDALAELTAKLSTTIVQSLTGRKEVVSGAYIEPMQLQVVCHRLWEGMDQDDMVVDLVDVQKHADVVTALAAYYNDATARIASRHHTPERAIRDWFSRNLITRDETRGQVQKGETETEGLPTAVVEEFVATYIVRVEERRTTRWYELSHDSLVRPVITANSHWRDTHLTPAQKAADTWHENGKPDGLLLTGETLAAAQSWSGVYTPIEREFLDRSAQRHAAEEAQRLAAIREAEQNRRLARSLWRARAFLALAGVCIALAGWQWVQAVREKSRADVERLAALKSKEVAECQEEEAERQAELAKAATAEEGRQRLLANSQAEFARTQEGYAKTALHAASMFEGARAVYLGQSDVALVHFARALRLDPASVSARTGIAEALQRAPWRLHRLSIPVGDGISSVAMSNDGKRIVLSDGILAQVWDVATGEAVGKPLRHTRGATRLAFHPGGTLVATTDAKRVLLWEAATGEPFGKPLEHANVVDVVAFSPNGSRIVTAAGLEARVWDIAPSAPVRKPMLHSGTVYGAVFSNDSKRILTASSDKTAQVWDAESGAPIGKALPHKDRVFTAVFDRRDRRVVTASGDRTAQVWNADTGAPIGKPMTHKSNVLTAVFSPDGQFVLTGSLDRSARLWDASTANPDRTGEQLGSPLVHPDSVEVATFLGDGSRFLTISREVAQVWDTVSRSPVGKPLIAANQITEWTLSPDGKRFATITPVGFKGKSLDVWDIASGNAVGQSLQHMNIVRRAAFSPDSQRVVTASADGTAAIWNVTSARPEGSPLSHDGVVASAVFSPNGRRVVTASRDGTARIWDAVTGVPVGDQLKHPNWVYRAAFSPDGRFVVTASDDNTGQIWFADTGKPFGKPLNHKNQLRGAEFSSNGKRIVTASYDKSAQVWDVATQSPVGKPMVHSDLIQTAFFSATGNRVVTASEDQTAQIWDASTGQRIGQPLRHAGPVNSAVFSADGLWVVTASKDKSAQVWDAATGDRVGKPMVHAGEVQSAAFSPEGRRVITASADKTAQMWDAASGAQIGSPILHGDIVLSAVFSPDGRRIVTASFDKTARVAEVLVDAGTPPEVRMLAELADAVGGATINEKGAMLPLPGEPARLRAIRAKALRFPAITGTLPLFIRRFLPE